MRASTLFAATVAVLCGLAVAVGAKVGGFFEPKTEVRTEAPPPPSLVVAARNLFAGDTIRQGDVKLRPARPAEIEALRSNGEKFLPGVLEAAYYRVPKENIEADHPILKDELQEMAKPSALSKRLGPNNRAVNVELPRDRSAGGLIQVNEWVDVFLTTAVENPVDHTVTIRTAPIARDVQVIAKRDTLWQTLAPIPADRPIHFTLATNPYRAALIEYAKEVGSLSLVPLPAAEQRRLEEQAAARARANDKDNPDYAFEPARPERRLENERIASYSRGDLAVGDEDLVRIFGLPPIPDPARSVTVERFVGVNQDAPAIYVGGVRQAAPSTPSEAGAPRKYHFRMPGGSNKALAARMQNENPGIVETGGAR